MAAITVPVVRVPEELLLELRSAAEKLKAMLSLACADDGEALRSLNENIQRQYLNACEDAAGALQQAIEQLTGSASVA